MSWLIPLNPPPAGATAAEMLAQRQASIDAFHVAALINAGLLVVGAAISFIGLREQPKHATPDSPDHVSEPVIAGG